MRKPPQQKSDTGPDKSSGLVVDRREQGNHAIAKMTVRCAQYVSALKIVGLGKRKISRRLRKNLHITIRR